MKKQNGITLIALVITIVVLLILAGVSLATLTGENGVLTRAENASLKNEEADDKEQIMLAMESYAIDKKTSEEDITLAEVIKKESWCKEAIYDETTDSTIVVIEECGHQYKVESDGTITAMLGVVLNKSKISLEIEEEGTITEILTAILNRIEGNITWTNSDDSVATISAEEGEEITITAVSLGKTTVTAECGEYTAACEVTVKGDLLDQIDEGNYGDYVDYKIDLDIVKKGYALSDKTVPKTDWRIFYKDDTNIFLIASDYLPTSKFPDGVFDRNDGKYSGYWKSGSIDSAKITTNTKFLFKELSKVTPTNNNYKVTATLLDSSKWSVFAKSEYVDDVNTSVIGSSTVEMWMESWNDKYNDTLSYSANSVGYKIGLNASSLDREISATDIQAKLGWNDTLYFPHANKANSWNSCSGCMLAAPASILNPTAEYLYRINWGRKYRLVWL